MYTLSLALRCSSREPWIALPRAFLQTSQVTNPQTLITITTSKITVLVMHKLCFVKPLRGGQAMRAEEASHLLSQPWSCSLVWAGRQAGSLHPKSFTLRKKRKIPFCCLCKLLLTFPPILLSFCSPTPAFTVFPSGLNQPTGWAETHKSSPGCRQNTPGKDMPFFYCWGNCGPKILTPTLYYRGGNGSRTLVSPLTSE